MTYAELYREVERLVNKPFKISVETWRPQLRGVDMQPTTEWFVHVFDGPVLMHSVHSPTARGAVVRLQELLAPGGQDGVNDVVVDMKESA